MRLHRAAGDRWDRVGALPTAGCACPAPPYAVAAWGHALAMSPSKEGRARAGRGVSGCVHTLARVARQDGNRRPVAGSGVSRAQSGLPHRKHRCGALAVPSRATCAPHGRMLRAHTRRACTLGGVARPRPSMVSWPSTPHTRHSGLGARDAQPWAASASSSRPAAAPGFLHRSSRLCHTRSPRLWRPTPGGASAPPRGCYKTPRRSPDGVYRRASR